MGERSSNWRHIHLIRRRTDMGERSSNFRDTHLHKKADKYGREIYQLERYTSS